MWICSCRCEIDKHDQDGYTSINTRKNKLTRSSFQVSLKTGQPMTDTLTTNPEHLILSIPSHPRYLQLVRGVFKKIGAIMDLPGTEAENIILAVDEACANVIKHSYMNQPHGKINLYLEILPAKLHVTIEDFGCKSDPARMHPRDIDDIKPGGLGLHIIDCVMDSVHFDCSSKTRNQLKMVKRFDHNKNP